MRKVVILLVIALAGCSKQNQEQQESVIDLMCHTVEDDVLTPEEIEYLDSVNAEGTGLIIRGAERNLDTIVNHTHLVFITEP